MPDYKLYHLDRRGHIVGPPRIIEADDDNKAMEAAGEYLDGQNLELWRENKRVKTFLHKA